ncbi:hypothetical protein S7711_06936 [Stachybotrys chartarum IBT 7711]|uniref:Acyltransferase 3 domain-containing protein n=1 Tax=Stachybotrys chartarum (strain CBS 109288 / IBT 7711) TaxID=1280523 RepID=A0A084AL49_STACB|nr:hypothetical protein S7711_06936 [Stachybotrys chartarum IBT 7711]KFA51429.1 hypothetical protein S40293_03213 [Stachybotrys chartarum IBT 40293]KFA74937.1 hypothetical protein S40288_06786 [Stachybotrys chartarum IBT 40288]
MLPAARDEAARAQAEHELELLPHADGPPGAEKAAVSSVARRNRDKIKALDGLRGIACLLVFNYHFLWPWTPMIMLGYGALPPHAPEPYAEWPSLPILCLLHRGRPMVAIFFAISGYVLCRHILRAIHERRIEAAYQSLASAVFRRAFRLYIPPTISMFLVAMLAQMGAFRAEDDIFKGRDSVYINGTITAVSQTKFPCLNHTIPATGPADIAEHLGVADPLLLGVLGNHSTPLPWPQEMCLNSSSFLFGPSALYTLVHEPESRANVTGKVDARGKPIIIEEPEPDNDGPQHQIQKVNNATDLVWVQFGGSWEEHPLIHDNITYALQNFTRVYAEWANPFNFGHYHPRYDPHTFTIPMELRGSIFLYVFLLATAAIKRRWRWTFAGILSAYSLQLGRWDMATFMGGMLLSEMDIWLADNDMSLIPPVTGSSSNHRPMRGAAVLRWAVFVLALYFLSYPDSGAEYTPGFVYLSSWVPRYYIPLSGWMFYQATGALLLLPCVLRSPLLCHLLEGRVAQYLGKVSFSFYLIHGPVLHGLGFWIMPRLFDRLSKLTAYAVGYVLLLSISLYLSNWWCRKVDGWSVTVGKRVERFVLE